MIDIAKILEILKDAFSALDDALGDSDLPVETDEEEREYAPVQYAARRVSEVMQILEPARAGEQRIEAELPQQDVAELCDCGEPFDESGKCDFCGACARYRNA